MKSHLKTHLRNYLYGEGDSPVYKITEAKIGAFEGRNEGYFIPVHLKMHILNNPKSPQIEVYGVLQYDLKTCLFKNELLGQADEVLTLNL